MLLGELPVSLGRPTRLLASGRRWGRLEDWTPRFEWTGYAGRSHPRAVQPFDPAFPLKAENQQAYRQPVPVARAAGVTAGAFLQVPAQVLQLPLVGTHVPAPPDCLGDVRRANTMMADRAAP